MTDNSDTDALLEGRKSTYGDTTQNAERVAKMWNGYLGTDIITPADMMMMMALYKAYRFKVTPDYSDNINDVLGYAQIVRDVQRETGGLIDAETVKEYLRKKNPIEVHDPVVDETAWIYEQYLRNRCGLNSLVLPAFSPCKLHVGHKGPHLSHLSIEDEEREDWEQVERNIERAGE